MSDAKHLLDQIERGLDGVTPGPWFEGDHWVFVEPATGEPTHPLENIFDHDKPQANAAHIARCSPDTMREIAAYVRETEARATAAEATVTEARRIMADLGGHARFVEANFDISYAHLHEAETFLSKGETEGWRPIKTAPKDEQLIIIGSYNARGQWCAEIWSTKYLRDEQAKIAAGFYTIAPHLEWSPSHWRPIPASPEQGGETHV